MKYLWVVNITRPSIVPVPILAADMENAVSASLIICEMTSFQRVFSVKKPKQDTTAVLVR
jgi:hypothetical protein